MKLKKILKSKRGEAYIGVVIFLLVAVFMTAFLIQMGGLVMTKLALDDQAKQVVKVVQLQGGVNDKTKATIENVQKNYSVDKNGDGDYDDAGEKVVKIVVTGESLVAKEGVTDEYMIQLGDSFEVNLKCGYCIGFGPAAIKVPLESRQVGVSEVYWKELA